jgi:uncharacterized SAM-binding protein YcdF (DUF218 family)
MNVIVDFLKLAARPASVPFFVFVLAAGLILAMTRRHTRALRWYLAAVLLGYWVFSAPACAERLTAWSGRGFHPLLDAAEARGAQVVVVLGAGSRTFRASGSALNMMSWEGAFRVLEGARLYRVLDHPTVIVSGGITSREKGSRPESEGMRDAIVQLGVPLDHVLMESESKTTREEALIIRRMFADRTDQPIVIVTSPSHMRRSVAVFQSVGLNPVPSVSAYKSDHAFEDYRWLPNQGALLLSDIVFYDTAAWWYYKARGWVPIGP